MMPDFDLITAYATSRQLLDRRVRRYRNLVVLIVVIGITSPLLAIIFGDWNYLLGWLAMFLAVEGFFVLDVRSIARWRAAILDGWVAGTIDLDAFREGILVNRLLPPATLSSLIDPLPTRARLDCFPDPVPRIREALAATVIAIDTILIRRTLSCAFITILTIILLIIGILTSPWWILCAALMYLIMPRLTRRMGRNPPRKWRATILNLEAGNELKSACQSLATRLDWSQLPMGCKDRWWAIVHARR